jgi:enoyl-CoA hydratase/carnithine racemase
MSYKSIILKNEHEFIGEIILNRPNDLNTFNNTLAIELNLLELDANDNIRVIIIKGTGKHFCAGIDLKEFSGKNVLQYKEWIECMEKPLITLSEIKKPVITQVHGVAAANGAGLVAASDLSIISEDSRIGLTAIKVGLNCIGPIVPVTRSVGRKKALELLFFGELIDAAEALRIGLVNKVVPSENLEKETILFNEERRECNPGWGTIWTFIYTLGNNYRSECIIVSNNYLSSIQCSF